MSAPPTRADLIAGSGDHRCDSRRRRGRIGPTQRRANGRGYTSRHGRPVVWLAGGCSGSSSLKRCRPPGFQMETGHVLAPVIIG